MNPCRCRPSGDSWFRPRWVSAANTWAGVRASRRASACGVKKFGSGWRFVWSFSCGDAGGQEIPAAWRGVGAWVARARAAISGGFDVAFEYWVAGRARASLGGPSRACDRCDDGGHNDARVVGRRHGRAERLRAGSEREASLGSAAAATERLSPASTWRASPSWAGPPGSGASASWPSSPSAELRSPSSRLCAWARRNSDQLGPIRRGAGPRPELRNTVATVVAETPIPSFSSSPSMRM
jgi:hypothetical protein